MVSYLSELLNRNRIADFWNCVAEADRSAATQSMQFPSGDFDGIHVHVRECVAAAEHLQHTGDPLLLQSCQRLNVARTLDPINVEHWFRLVSYQSQKLCSIFMSNVF